MTKSSLSRRTFVGAGAALLSLTGGCFQAENQKESKPGRKLLIREVNVERIESGFNISLVATSVTRSTTEYGIFHVGQIVGTDSQGNVICKKSTGRKVGNDVTLQIFCSTIPEELVLVTDELACDGATTIEKVVFDTSEDPIWKTVNKGCSKD